MAAGEHIRFRGIVQGVGFRPTVARVARALGLRGWVRNDADGVLVAVVGDGERFVRELLAALPPLARVEQVERAPADVDGDDFVIVHSEGGEANTAVAPDAAVCAACRGEVLDPAERRAGYPFTTCTHCGPRFSIVTGIPYDRAQTTMRAFPMCDRCRAEYTDEVDRRYHAQPVACPDCGPRLALHRGPGAPVATGSEALAEAVAALRRGEIVAVKGLGGYQLCCDATDPAAVARLRARKRRPHKPLACMGRDMAVIRACAEVSAVEEEALASPENPIVLLRRRASALADEVAPDQGLVGFFLPTTPLHVLLLRDIAAPIVCTSGNLTEEPQCTDDDDGLARLAGIADVWLAHDRPIANRVDDSVSREIDGAVRVLRRARGYAPAPLPLPPELDGPPVLALGGDLKAVFALAQRGVVVPSQHLGDLHDLKTLESWQHALELLSRVFDHAPQLVAVDLHPDYTSTRLGRELAEARGLPIVEVQHHHAHVAAVLAENGRPGSAPPVVGITLDGVGYGADGGLWGGEVLLADYRGATRVAHLRPAALIGGDAAAREPWRCLYAQLHASGLPTTEHPVLRGRPHAVLERMLATGTQSPPTSSAGRLFDAVAAAVGLYADGISFEGQAAMALEALAAATDDDGAYTFAGLDPAPMWAELLADLARGVSRDVIAARFHRGLAKALVSTASSAGVDTAALSGGVFANRVLAEAVADGLRAEGMAVLQHRRLPPGDGGIAVGQAVVAIVRSG